MPKKKKKKKTRAQVEAEVKEAREEIAANEAKIADLEASGLLTDKGVQEAIDANKRRDQELNQRDVHARIKLRLLEHRMLSKKERETEHGMMPEHLFHFGAVLGDVCPFEMSIGVAATLVGELKKIDSLDVETIEDAAFHAAAMPLGDQLLEAAQFGVYFLGICPPEPEAEEALEKALGAVQAAGVPLEILIANLHSLADGAEESAKT